MAIRNHVMSLLFCLTAGAAPAGVLDDIGWSRLAAELGGDMPDGSGVPVAQIEASNANAPEFHYAPNPSQPEFDGKSMTDVSGLGTDHSAHANGIARKFYGNTVSAAPGITRVENHYAGSWLGSDYLLPATPLLPNPQPAISANRIANHSWIASTGDAETDRELLGRLDWVVDRDEYIQVTGFTGHASRPLLSSAFNVIAVNKIDAQATGGSARAAGIYTAGRVRPDLVVPERNPSGAVPRVASAVALLIQTAHARPRLSTDPRQTVTSNRDGLDIFNGERSEVIKAVLMAGARRSTANSGNGDIPDYRQAFADRTANGLDRRYGAGQLDIYNSFHIVTAGEQNSIEDHAAGRGRIGPAGFDYDPFFGGASGSNDQASYFFRSGGAPVRFAAALVWNLQIDGGTAKQFDGTPTLHDLNLFLYDRSDPDEWLLVGSAQSLADNSEHLWLELMPDTPYALRVTAAGRFNHDFALAWQQTRSPTRP